MRWGKHRIPDSSGDCNRGDAPFQAATYTYGHRTSEGPPGLQTQARFASCTARSRGRILDGARKPGGSRARTREHPMEPPEASAGSRDSKPNRSPEQNGENGHSGRLHSGTLLRPGAAPRRETLSLLTLGLSFYGPAPSPHRGSSGAHPED